VKSVWLGLIVGLYWLLHQDFVFWRAARPLAFGFLPIGLAYHALYTLGTVALIAFLIRVAWPHHLDEEVDGRR
jgi:hypothetical protein